jgi:hypothetical protein
MFINKAEFEIYDWISLWGVVYKGSTPILIEVSHVNFNQINLMICWVLIKLYVEAISRIYYCILGYTYF